MSECVCEREREREREERESECERGGTRQAHPRRLNEATGS